MIEPKQSVDSDDVFEIIDGDAKERGWSDSQIWEVWQFGLSAQHTLAADGDNMCRAVEHFYIDDVCAGCGRIRPAAKA